MHRRWCTGLETLRPYWATDPNAVDTYSVWARMSYSAPGVSDLAVNKSLIAASRYFAVSGFKGTQDAFNNPLVHLSNAINLLLQHGQHVQVGSEQPQPGLCSRASLPPHNGSSRCQAS